MKQRIFTFIAAALMSVMAGNASVVFSWADNIGSISYVGGATATTVKTQTNTVSTACIKFLAKYDKGDYVELTSSTGSFLAGDIITIDYCINNSDASKVGRVAVYTANDSLLAESEPAVNGRLEDGYSTFQYQLRSDMNVIRIARGPSTGTATYILRLEVVRAGTPAPTVVHLADVANYIDFHALSLTDPEMTDAYVTSTNPFTLDNGTVLLGKLKSDGTEVINTWLIKDSYNTVLPTPEWTGVDSLRVGTFFRAGSGTQLQLGAFRTSNAGKLRVYFQPNGDSDRGVQISISDGEHLYEYRKSGVKINNVRPAYEVACDLPAGNYYAGTVVISVVGNTSNIFGVRIDELAEEVIPVEYSVTAYASPSNGGYVDVQYNADHSYAYLTAYPSTGYQFAGWSDGRTDNPRTIALSEDLNLTAYFTQTIPSEYWYWKGYVDGYDIVTENNNNIFQNGISSITVDAYAYLFVIHQKSGYPGEQYMSEYYVDGPTHATMTKTGMEKIRIPVGTHTLYLYDNGDGTVELAYQPMAGKTLIGNGQPSVQYTVTANVNPSTAGYVNVQYDNKHHQATLTAYPYSGYHFSCWSDGNTDNPRTLLLESNVTLTANFTKDITSGPQVWPIMMDETTYASIQSSVVADFRPNDYSNFVFSWDDSYSVANNYGLNFYGLAEGWLSFIVGTKGWAGGSFYVEDDYQSVEILRQTIVANPDDYYLHFAIKSTDNYSHTFYIIDNDQTNFAIGTTNSYYAGGPIYGDFARDGQWHEFYIPMTQFAASLASANVNHSSNLFAFLTEGVQGAQLNLDAVYFCNTAFKNSQTKPTYTVTTNVFPREAGTVEVTEPSARNVVTMTAMPNTGYHFLRWNDGNQDNPRKVILYQDTTFTAIFEHDLMHVTYIGMNGVILGSEEVPYGERAHQAGINPDVFGYTFLGWDKPLTNITEDITVYATYRRDAINGFYYLYDLASMTATLDHEGDSYKQMKVLNVPNRFIYRGMFFNVTAVGAYAFENCDRLTDVVVPSNVEYIRESAFSGCSDMIRLTVSANLRGIEDYAFQGCKRLEEITVYAERVPDLTATSFANVGNKKYINVYAPDNRVNQYKRDEYWSEFNIVVKSAETITENVEDVTVEPEESTAQFTWPTESNAGSYTIVISKDGVVFCTLIFNANGQLTGIAFAPGRDGNNAPAAVLTSNGGMQFTVTGLDAGTHYGYTVTTKDTQDRVIATYEGEFDTFGSLEDGIEEIMVNGEGMNGKFLMNGQIFILRNGKLYTVTGQAIQ